jgi:hypothetical protein
LACLVLAGLAIRSYGIGGIDFWYDEMGLWLYSVTGNPSPPSEPPLMAWLLYIWMWWVKSGDSFHIHFLPVLLGSLSIPLAYLFAAKVDENRITGLAAALLTTLSPMAIFYSREGRPYALFILVSGSLYLSCLWANETNSRKAWLVYSLLLFLCGLSHLLTAEIVLALGIFAIAARLVPRFSRGAVDFRARRFVNFVLFSVVGGLGILWILQRSAGPVLGAFAGAYQFGLVSFVRSVLINLGPGPVRAYTEWSLGLPEILAAVFCALYVAGLRRLHGKGRDDLVLFLVLALSVPLLVKYFTLGWRGSWDWMRWMSHALLPFLVVVSVGLESVRRSLGAYVYAGGVALLVAGLLSVALDLPERAEYQEYENIARYTQEHAGELKGVVFLPYRHDLGGGDPRITNIYYHLKREVLPGYELTGGEMRKIVLVSTRGDITRIAQANRYPENRLESGRYAVLWRRPFDACDDIPRWLSRVKVTAGETLPIMNGLTVCELAFSE